MGRQVIALHGDDGHDSVNSGWVGRREPLEGPHYCLGEISKGISKLEKSKVRYMRSEREALAGWTEMGARELGRGDCKCWGLGGSKSGALRPCEKCRMVGRREVREVE